MVAFNAEHTTTTVDQAGVPQPPTSRACSAQTGEKRARKRELDRISQRRKRQKDRETMNRLRNSLEQPHDPSWLHHLVLKQEADLARLHRHGERMIQIQTLLQADLADLDQAPPCEQQNRLSPSSDDNANPSQLSMKAASPQVGPNLNIAAPYSKPQFDVDGLSWDDMEVLRPEQSVPLIDVPRASDNHYLDPLLILTNENVNGDRSILTSSCESRDPPRAMQSRHNSFQQSIESAVLPKTEYDRSCTKCESVWRMANLNISLARQQFRARNDSQLANRNGPDIDSHLIITAIAEGWSSAERSPLWDDRWNMLRQVDEICHGESGLVERLVTLYTVRRILKVNSVCSPDDQMAGLWALPKFLHERRVPLLFAQSIKFLWPYEFRDTYVRNRNTNLYEFSKTFLHQANDLGCYTLDSSFFAKYPEFQGDVPIYQSLPRLCSSISSHSTSWQYFPVNQQNIDGWAENGPIEVVE
ncbi:hypothetical protein BP6252_08928 [Coleophoma cylindrospora]|uniref:Uncharacterized protein n=1 Tax=Coleophoma cylindrospora TaxID=1849047 RepID=A0A3D8R0F6_9HELO|nr:hypothetical protein BP6252_08928 [Coleophoma cylindrospora]